MPALGAEKRASLRQQHREVRALPGAGMVADQHVVLRLGLQVSRRIFKVYNLSTRKHREGV
ncbi:hypothetical protein [Hymenobacter setariae]|uniref:hypothetical protein n=1 Tax=Hymenobacter setariae TaxID=2594794 RepID=UPI001F278831|nr:hypothetical protein [Hymenobacter setariae]